MSTSSFVHGFGPHRVGRFEAPSGRRGGVPRVGHLARRHPRLRSADSRYRAIKVSCMSYTTAWRRDVLRSPIRCGVCAAGAARRSNPRPARASRLVARASAASSEKGDREVRNVKTGAIAERAATGTDRRVRQLDLKRRGGNDNHPPSQGPRRECLHDGPASCRWWSGSTGAAVSGAW